MKHPDKETLSAMMDGEWQDGSARRAVVDVCRDETLRACWARYHLARDAMHAESLDVRGSVAERVSAALADEPAYSNVTAIGGLPAAAAPVRDAAPDDAATAVAGGAIAGVPSAGAAVAPARGSSVRTFATGFGLAASVALVTAVGLNVWRDGAPGAGNAPDTIASASGTAEAVGSDPAALAVAPAAPVSADAFSLQLPGAPLPRVELVSNTGAYWSAPDSSARREGSEERLNMFLSRHIEHSPTAERQGMLPYSRLVGYDERPEAR